MIGPFLAVVRREGRVSARLLLLLLVGLLLVAYLMASAFPAFQERMLAAGRRAPSFVRRMLESRAGGFHVEQFLGLLYAHPVVLALFATWPISRAVQAIAGEIERGALAWKLAYPIGRVAYVGAKALVLWAGMAVLSAALAGGFWASLEHLKLPHAGPAPYAWAALSGFALYGAIGMVTLWASAASRRVGPPALFGAGVALGSYLLHYVADMWPVLAPYAWLSLFHYADQAALLGGAAPKAADFAVLAGVAAVALAGALVTFARRDLSI